MQEHVTTLKLLILFILSSKNQSFKTIHNIITLEEVRVNFKKKKKLSQVPTQATMDPC